MSGALVALALLLAAPDPLAAACKKGDAAACSKYADKIVQRAAPGEDEEAADWYEAGCDLGDGAACLRGGRWARDRHGALLELAEALFRKGCDKDGAEACVALGKALERPGGLDARPAPEAARAAFAKGCALGSAEGCSEEGRMLRTSRQLAPDPARARSLWDEACRARHAPACIALALADRDGWGGARDRAKALERLDAACAARSREACWWAMFERARGDLDVSPEAAAQKTLEADCPDGHGPALPCYLAARLVQLGRAPARPGVSNATLLAKACTRDFPEGCSAHAGALVYARVKGAELDAALRTLEANCDRSDPEACAWLAHALYNGLGRTPDAPRATALAEGACARGSSEACALWGIMQVNGVGTPKDEVAGMELLDRTCRGGFPRACVAAAGMHEQKRIAGADATKAKTYRALACRLGFDCK